MAVLCVEVIADAPRLLGQRTCGIGVGGALAGRRRWRRRPRSPCASSLQPGGDRLIQQAARGEHGWPGSNNSASAKSGGRVRSWAATSTVRPCLDIVATTGIFLTPSALWPDGKPSSSRSSSDQGVVGCGVVGQLPMLPSPVDAIRVCFTWPIRSASSVPAPIRASASAAARRRRRPGAAGRISSTVRRSCLR